jgi:hypothetical protein
MESFGFEKRELLVDRVQEARQAQQKAKEQFASALDRFIAVTNYQGGEVEKEYNELSHHYEISAERAENVHERIDDVEKVAQDLFEEWNEELDEFSDDDLRVASSQQLRDTRASYQTLIAAMRKAEDKIQPVLVAYHDRVLYLKHNLNASAISALREQKGSFGNEVNTLITDMNEAIAEADRFIQSMTLKDQNTAQAN